MSFLKQLLETLGLMPPATLREFHLDEEVRLLLYDLANRERRPVDEIASELLLQALGDRRVDGAVSAWDQLTPRQQEVAALICLGYTNQQIASRLSISPETVKSHIRAVLKRFRVRSKVQLRRDLSHWDFSEWE
jgi:DNA-binding CsgD family transcriptional regulator